MKVGSLVETVGNFERVRIEWGFDYMRKGEILTVSDISEHPNQELSAMGIVLLNFYEYPNLVGVCDKTFNGKLNFIELQPPMDLSFIDKMTKESTLELSVANEVPQR